MYHLICTSYNKTKQGLVLRNNWIEEVLNDEELLEILKKWQLPNDFKYLSIGSISGILEGKMELDIPIHVRIIRLKKETIKKKFEITTQEIRDRIENYGETGHDFGYDFNCNGINCSECPFDTIDISCDELNFDFEKMKKGNETTLIELLKYKLVGEDKNYSNLK